MQFKRIYIIGNGVMGKLLHQRIERFYNTQVVVFDKDDTIYIANGSPEEPNLVIVCTPISTITHILIQISSQNPAHTYICEIGSVKGKLVREYASIFDDRENIFFESVHPMVGPLATDWNVFNWNKNCIIIQEDLTKSPKTLLISRFWREIGFNIRRMDPTRHDEVIGKLSHLSHYMILAYVDFVESTLREDELRLAGPSFDKFKELAKGAQRLEDIYVCNESLPELVESYSKHMKKLLGEMKGE